MGMLPCDRFQRSMKSLVISWFGRTSEQMLKQQQQQQWLLLLLSSRDHKPHAVDSMNGFDFRKPLLATAADIRYPMASAPPVSCTFLVNNN